MKSFEPLERFEWLCSHLAGDQPPAVRVAARVMTLIRFGESASDRTLEAVAVTSFVLAMVIALLGFSQMTEASSSLDALFQIVPPIGP